MSLDVVIVILGVLALLFAGLIFGLSLKLTKGIIGIITVIILFIAGVVIIFFVVLSFRDNFTSDYRCVDTINTYQVHNITFNDEAVTVYYLDTNKEVKHIRSVKTKIFYDLGGSNKEPYVVRNRYWRWFIYWDELEIHLNQ